MEEDAFWSLMETMNGSSDEGACHRLFLALRRLEPPVILALQDRLGEVLHRMDLRSIAKQRWRDTEDPRWLPRLPGISADGFL